MFGIGGFELFLILLFGFLIFGPDKLPQIAKTIGMAVQKFRSAQDEMNKVVKTEIYDKEREDKKKREAANEAAKEVRSAAAAEKQAASADGSAAKTPAQVHEEVMTARKEATAKAAAEHQAEKASEKDLADEIFGAKPAVRSAASARSASGAGATSDAHEKEDN